MKVLFIGDIVGNPGRKVIRKNIPNIKREYKIDFCVANAENSAGGAGLTGPVAQEIFSFGIDAITLGNHAWARKEIVNLIDNNSRIIRPANFPPHCPGNGSTVLDGNREKLGIINIMGRIYMDSSDCPFRTVEKEIDYIKSYTNIILVDMHAEATSEKQAMGWYLDGKVSCVLGTHTHVQTCDERILPNGTGYITDVGMTGPYDGILGVRRDQVINKFIACMPEKFVVAKGPVQLNAVVVEIDSSTGKTTKIERIFRIYDEI